MPKGSLSLRIPHLPGLPSPRLSQPLLSLPGFWAVRGFFCCTCQMSSPFLSSQRCTAAQPLSCLHSCTAPMLHAHLQAQLHSIGPACTAAQLHLPRPRPTAQPGCHCEGHSGDTHSGGTGTRDLHSWDVHSRDAHLWPAQLELCTAGSPSKLEHFMVGPQTTGDVPRCVHT